jgi:hypothetical protein
MLPGKHPVWFGKDRKPPSAGGTLPNAAKFTPYVPKRIKLGHHSFGINKALILGHYFRNTFFAFGCCKHAARTVRCSAVGACGPALQPFRE